METKAIEFVTLDTVVVVGNSLDFPDGVRFTPSTSRTTVSPQVFTVASPSYQVMMSAVRWSNVCLNPFISSTSKQVTGQDDADARWLAAQDVFTTLYLRGLLPSYREAYGKLSIIMNGKKYDGFSVTYADGYTEVWAVNPGYATSSFKLFDTPLPGSLKASTGGTTCSPKA